MANKDRDFIKRSNDRSKSYGIDPNQKKSKHILSQKELNSIITNNHTLISVSEPFINQLYSFVKDSEFLVILTDREGRILNITGNEDMLQKAHDTWLVPGASMNEEDAGTNGMGTSIREGYPLQVTGKEHVLKILQNWTCSGAPIRDHEGKIIGCIDLTGSMELVNSHTLGMVAAAASAIEYMIRNTHCSSLHEKMERYLDTIINSLPSGIFTVDMDGKVVLANDYTYKILGYSSEAFSTVKGEELFPDWERIVGRIKKGESIYQEDVYINLDTNKNEVNLSAYPVNGEGDMPYEIVFVVKDVKKMRKLANKVTGSRAVYTFDKVIGEDHEFIRIIDFAKKVADSKSTVLLLGESGTGKEIFAQSIQNHSDRKNEPFVALNCGAIPKNLIESELFGYVGGAFTGANIEGQPGKFEIADGGTLFLDEIGEMPYELQTRLLRVIEEGNVRRVGGSLEIPVDVRIIAATNKNLREEVDKGNFRKDLYYRLNVLPLRLPPLRERPGDIPLLFDFFMKRKAKSLSKKPVEVPDYYMDMLKNHNWPGNIRELENLVELIINTESFPTQGFDKDIDSVPAMKVVSDRTLEDIEADHIKRILKKYDGNITLVSKKLGIGRNTLYRKIEKYDIGV
ncbi:sigma-54-dependent Fis family transcriptional regulator [Gudongella sp. DL1XJH-153]|uniref:sigma-54-dependent Fis family transcriptional regulator n=1 Tax=Gudongella sp. DL1XJH-153 TaxID=3409804 RepID=UPI003BB7C5BD